MSSSRDPFVYSKDTISGLLAAKNSGTQGSPVNLLDLERLQISKEIVDRSRREHELRHLPCTPMSNDDALRQRFGQSLHIIALMQRPERRRGSIRTRSGTAHGVAGCAMPFGNRATALDVLR